MSIFIPEHNLIFIHVPRTGGSSMERTPLLCCATSHDSIRVFRDLLAPETFRSAFKFGFVRNPWDRYVSAFRAGQAGIGSNDLAFEVRDHAMPPQSPEHFRAQWEFVCDEDGNLLVDCVGHYETLEEDWAKICRAVGCEVYPLGHERKTERKPYQEYYTAEQALALKRIYARDVMLFGYKFGEDW